MYVYVGQKVPKINLYLLSFSVLTTLSRFSHSLGLFDFMWRRKDQIGCRLPKAIYSGNNICPTFLLLLLLKIYWRLTNNKIVYFRHQLVWSVDQNDLLPNPLVFFYSLPQICYFKVLKNKTIAFISRVIL